MCIGITMTASASANAECKHPNVTQNSEIVAHWTGSHQVTLVQSKGPETCTYAHWMENFHGYAMIAARWLLQTFTIMRAMGFAERTTSNL